MYFFNTFFRCHDKLSFHWFWSQKQVKKIGHPSLTNTFFQGFKPKHDFYTVLKLWSQRIQFCHPQGHPQRARKSSPNTFFSARVAGGNFHIFLFTNMWRWYQIVQKKSRFWRFWHFWKSYGHLRHLEVWEHCGGSR